MNTKNTNTQPGSNTHVHKTQLHTHRLKSVTLLFVHFQLYSLTLHTAWNVILRILKYLLFMMVNVVLQDSKRGHSRKDQVHLRSFQWNEMMMYVSRQFVFQLLNSPVIFREIFLSHHSSLTWMSFGFVRWSNLNVNDNERRVWWSCVQTAVIQIA